MPAYYNTPMNGPHLFQLSLNTTSHIERSFISSAFQRISGMETEAIWTSDRLKLESILALVSIVSCQLLRTQTRTSSPSYGAIQKLDTVFKLTALPIHNVGMCVRSACDKSSIKTTAKNDTYIPEALQPLQKYPSHVRWVLLEKKKT